MSVYFLIGLTLVENVDSLIVNLVESIRKY